MALVKMKDLLLQARQEGRACGAFNVGNMEMVMGAVQAACELRTPIILQIAEIRLPHSPLALIGPMMVEAARQADVDIAVHLDHGKSGDVMKQALDLGFTSIMYDGSQLPLEDNIANTQEVRALADGYSASLEAELGLVGGSEDNSGDHGIRFTDPEHARLFCEQTHVDALAVAIGNAHGNYPVTPVLAFDALEKIRDSVEVPLVLHGGSGITDSDFRKAISLGIRKINIATASFNSLTAEVEAYCKTEAPHTYFGLNEAMRRGTAANVSRHIRVFNCGND